LGEKVARRIDAPAVRVLDALADARALYADDHRKRQRGSQQGRRQELERGKRERPHPAWNQALVLDQRHFAPVEERDADRGQHQRDERGEGADPRACERDCENERQNADRDRGRAHLADASHQVEDLRHLGAAARGDADERSKLIEYEHHSDTDQETRHHRVRHEAHQPAQPQQAKEREKRAGQKREQEDRRRALLLGIGRDRLARGERRRAGGRDLHELGARERAPDDGRRDRGVEAVDGVDARERRRGEPVGNAHHRVDQPCHRVLPQRSKTTPQRSRDVGRRRSCVGGRSRSRRLRGHASGRCGSPPRAGSAEAASAVCAASTSTSQARASAIARCVDCPRSGVAS
jgi:hypothetical protein